MIELSYLSLVYLGELVFILSLACGISLFRSLRNRKRDYQAARKLVAAIRQDEDQRNAAVRKLLESGYRYEGAQLDQTVSDLIRAEKMFYQTLINAYLDRDSATFGRLNRTLAALTDIYENLKVPEVNAEPADSGSEVDLQYLRDKNQRLSDELSETMETMGRMLTEYSSILEDGADEVREDESVINLTGETAQDALDDENEEDLSDLAISPQSASEDIDPQIQRVDLALDEDSLEMTEDAVDGLLEDVAKQVESNAEPPAEEPETIDSAADDTDALQIDDQEDLSGAFDDLEEIDIETDIPPKVEGAKRTGRGS